MVVQGSREDLEVNGDDRTADSSDRYISHMLIARTVVSQLPL